ncbi:hypothetical protein [Kitasatospora sp. GAS204B]|uniref:hypothetical protein n=2 Tax=Kitasatospora TaxID=2063 RepID=UPI002475421A|nr:hypothetical protein [Kitasatospora sp. GAS204B]
MSTLLAASPVLILMTVCYAALCAASPFGDCRRCRGFGFQLKYDRRGRPCRGKHCRRCDGIGKRIRLGRHLYNVAVRLRTGAR